VTTTDPKSNPSRFNASGIAMGVGVGAALCVSSGPVAGIPLGVGLAIAFGFALAQRC
jgi:hypothetical protein